MASLGASYSLYVERHAQFSVQTSRRVEAHAGITLRCQGAVGPSRSRRAALLTPGGALSTTVKSTETITWKMQNELKKHLLTNRTHQV